MPPRPPAASPPSMHHSEMPVPNTAAGSVSDTPILRDPSALSDPSAATAAPSMTTSAQCPSPSPQDPHSIPSPIPSLSPPTAPTFSEDDSFEITVIDIYDLSRTKTFSLATARTVSEALVANGYLGSSPIKPSLAVSFKTLELFRCVRLFKSSFSVEAFAKLLCHYYLVSMGSHTFITTAHLLCRRFEDPIPTYISECPIRCFRHIPRHPSRCQQTGPRCSRLRHPRLESQERLSCLLLQGEIGSRSDSLSTSPIAHTADSFATSPSARSPVCIAWTGIIPSSACVHLVAAKSGTLASSRRATTFSRESLSIASLTRCPRGLGATMHGPGSGRRLDPPTTRNTLPLMVPRILSP